LEISVKTTLSLAVAVLLATTAAGSAADLAVKSPAYISPAPVWSWTGFYIGAHAGAGWGTTESTLDSITAVGVPALLGLGLPIAQNSRSGFLGGGQIGYNYQSGWAVFGVQGDFAGLDVKGTTPCLTVLSCNANSHWLATATGRIGGVVADRTLVYIKGGGAWMNTTHTLTVPAAGGLGGGGVAGLTGSSADSNTFGWLLGFGAEYAFSPNWSGFIEYDYMDFDKKSIALNLTVPGGPVGAANVSIQNKLSVAKIGVNYKFDYGAPVVAKY
jgi:outer membrane immunogenic protein